MKPYLLLLLMLLLTACTNPVNDPSDTWSNHINTVIIPTIYHVNYYSTFSSSSGTRLWDITYDVANENVILCNGNYTFSGRETTNTPCTLSEDYLLMNEIQSKIKTLDMGIFQKYNDMLCYYNITDSNEATTHFVCFNQENNIVAYGVKGGYGGLRTAWYIDGYNPNSEWYQ